MIMRFSEILHGGVNLVKRYLPMILRQGILAILTLMPGGIATRVLHRISWRPLRWLLLLLLEPLLQRAVYYVTRRYRLDEKEKIVE